MIEELENLIEETNEKIGTKGVPTAYELTKKLDEINRGVEEEHSKFLKAELAKLEERVSA